MNHPDAPAPAGWRVVPEVAAAAPTVSADGLTYSFRIRRGFRFSPPSNEPVTASTFKSTIERALSPRLGPGAAAAAFAGDIAGVAAYRAGRAQHVSGITARGDMLTIRLVAPAADLPTRMALPFFCAVPVGTPIILNGLEQPIPTAGPYYLAEHIEGVVAVLKRNPNYEGARPQHLDAIVYRRPKAGKADAISEVERGEADHVGEYDAGLGELVANLPIADRYGPPRRPAARARGWAREGATERGRTAPVVASYVRVALGSGASGRLRDEEGFYRTINEGHRRHFAAMDVAVGSVGIAASKRSDLLEVLAPYHTALDLPIVRVLADEDATLLGAVADAAAP